MQIIKFLVFFGIINPFFVAYSIQTISSIREEAADCIRLSLNVVGCNNEEDTLEEEPNSKISSSSDVAARSQEIDYSPETYEKKVQHLKAVFEKLGIDDEVNQESAENEPLQTEEELQKDVFENEQFYIDLISKTTDNYWLSEFSKQASAQAILLIAPLNKALYNIREAQDKIFQLEPAHVAFVLANNKNLIPAYAEKAPDKHVLHTCRLEKSIKEHPAMQQRLLTIEQKRATVSTSNYRNAIELDSPAFSKAVPSFKDHNRYYRPNKYLGRDGDQPRFDSTKTLRQRTWDEFRERQELCAPGELGDTGLFALSAPALENVLRDYARKKDPQLELKINRLLKHTSDRNLVVLTEQLNPEHFALCCDIIDRKLSKPDAWKQLEDRIVTIHEEAFEALTPSAQRIISKKANAILQRQMHRSTCELVLQKYLKHGYGPKSYGSTILTLAQDVRKDDRLAFDLESKLAGAQQKIFQAQAEVAYQKISEAVKKYKNAPDENALRQFAQMIDPYTKTAEFNNLLKKRSTKDVTFLHTKVAEYDDNQKLMKHFGLQRDQFEKIAESFQIDMKKLVQIYDNDRQNKVQVTGVQLLNNLVTYKHCDEETLSVIGDCINTALELNAENKIEQADALMQALEYVSEALMGVCHEMYIQGVGQAKAAIIWMPVLTAVSIGLPLIGIPAAPALAAFSLGMTLYHLSQRPGELRSQINDLVDTIAQGQAFEAGKLATRLGLETVGTVLACKNLQRIFSQAHKSGILSETKKKVKAGLRTAKELNTQSKPVPILSAITEFDEQKTAPYNGNAIKSVRRGLFDKAHIFSDEHQKDEIFKLGSSEEEIIQIFDDYVVNADKRGILKEGTSQLHVLIKKHKVTIRCRIENGLLLKVNGFMGETERKLGNVIYWDDYE